MPVAEMLARMSSRELAEWQAFYRLEAASRQRAELDAKAAAGVSARRGRRGRG